MPYKMGKEKVVLSKINLFQIITTLLKHKFIFCYLNHDLYEFYIREMYML